MRRLFFDAMLLIYLLEGNPKYTQRVQEILTIAYSRNDRLFTSFLGLGEVMAGAGKSPVPATPQQIRGKLDDAGFSYLEFGESAVHTFAHIRSTTRVKSADAINLACAAAARMDLFLTGDKELMKLHVPGIQFIADFDTPIL
jgi:predicted nucleic acid-binding protein